jgi:Major coat protein-like
MVKMVDMKRTAAEKKARDKQFDHKISGEDYPYGLGISLGDSELSKLGVAKLPQVGSKLKIHAHAHVKSASESSSEGGRKQRRVELELRHMHVEGAHGEKGKTPKEDMSEEGMRRGAKAAMDKVLPKSKVTNKDLGSDKDDDDDDDGEE